MESKRTRSSAPGARQFARARRPSERPGIPKDVLGRIFDPFFTTKATGTGLGLAIAQQLEAENGARLDVASAPGGPTVFAITCESTPPSSDRGGGR